MKNGEVLMLAGMLMLVLISAGCTDGIWERLWSTGDEVATPSPGPDNISGSDDSPVGSETPTHVGTVAGLNNSEAQATPTAEESGNTTPSVLVTATTAVATATTDAGSEGDADAGSFSIQYTPPDGYTAAEGETLEMVFTIVPEGGFDDEVLVTLDLAVPDPVFGVFPLWSESYDLGTHAPPYPPITQMLVLDPENPPEEYAWVTGVYDTARSAGISEIDVNVQVSASGGGMTVEEHPVYHVLLT